MRVSVDHVYGTPGGLSESLTLHHSIHAGLRNRSQHRLRRVAFGCGIRLVIVGRSGCSELRLAVVRSGACCARLGASRRDPR